MKTNLRILDYVWHQAHSHRLHALPAEFTYVAFRALEWGDALRPRPANYHGMIQPEQVRASDFDLAIAHLDQWCDGTSKFRALPYRRMVGLAREFDIPLVVIMHGTPDSVGNRKRMLMLMEDWPIICNSVAAAREWDGGEGHLDRYGLPKFRAIIHGYDVGEWWSYPLDQRSPVIVNITSGGEVSRLYHGIPLLERLRRDVPLDVYGPSGNKPWMSSFDGYRDMLARSLVYFSPTRRAPMPGARTEAALSGCCIVSVPGQDVEHYIEHGRTGYIVDTYAEARSVLRMLLAQPDLAWKVGQAGREVACVLFDKRRYVADWMQVLFEIGVDFQTEHDEIDDQKALETASADVL